MKNVFIYIFTKNDVYEYVWESREGPGGKMLVVRVRSKRSKDYLLQSKLKSTEMKQKHADCLWAWLLHTALT